MKRLKKFYPAAFTFLLVIIFSANLMPQNYSTSYLTNKSLTTSTFLPFNYSWETVPDNIRNTNAFKRYEWFYRTRVTEHGDFPKEFIEIQKFKEMMKIKQYEQLNPYGTSDLWTNIGPKGVDMSNSFIPYWGVCSGRIRGIDIHPSNPNIIYIGAAAGGIWKSVDGGNTWTDISSGLNLLTFGAIAVDPGNPEIIYAGTGESRWSFNNSTYEGDGLYKSVNGGITWTKITNGFGSSTQFSAVKVSPANSNIIMAAIAAGNWNNSAPINQGIWRSIDAGITWTRVIETSGAFDVAFNPINGDIVYAGVGDQNNSGGFLISNNAGVSFTQSNNGLPDMSLCGRIQFDLCRTNPSVIYCLIHNSSEISGGMRTCAYKSVNGGALWNQISQGVNIAGSYDGTNVNDQGSYDLCLAVHPQNTNIAFFGNVEISKTSDGSNISFVRNPSGYSGGTGAWDCYAHVDIHRILIAPTNPNIVYVCCDGGIYRSNNGGSTFSHCNTGINTIQFYRVASHPTNPDILFGGAQDNGNFGTQNRGATSWEFKTSGDGMDCFVDYSNPNYIFMSTQNGSLKRSTDAGSNWQSVYSNSSYTAWCAPYWQHPTQSNKIYAALNQKIFISTSSGSSNSWNELSAAMPSIGTNRITSVTHSKVNTNKMMAAASYYSITPKLYSSADEGQSWNLLTFNYTGANVTWVEADPLNENTYYVTRASYTTDQLLKTTDFGATWTSIGNGLPDISANTVFIDPLNTNHIYVGNDFGVYWSFNGGAVWRKLNNQFPFVPVLDFSMYSNAGTRYLRAATHGRGVYEINIDQPLPVNEPEIPLPEKYSLKQNYPNPFNPVTTIKFELPENAFVTLNIYDGLGKLIKTLVRSQLEAGVHSMEFNAGNLSSGVYYFRLVAGKYSEIRKGVLIK